MQRVEIQASCQYHDATTCSNHGVAQANGSCICETGFVGPNCQYSDSVTCSSMGTAQYDGSCVCRDTFKPPACKYSDVYTCHSRGTANSDGSCTCNSSYAGSTCNGCAANAVCMKQGPWSWIPGGSHDVCIWDGNANLNYCGPCNGTVSDNACVCSLGWTGVA